MKLSLYRICWIALVVFVPKTGQRVFSVFSLYDMVALYLHSHLLTHYLYAGERLPGRPSLWWCFGNGLVFPWTDSEINGIGANTTILSQSSLWYVCRSCCPTLYIYIHARTHMTMKAGLGLTSCARVQYMCCSYLKIVIVKGSLIH